MKKSIRDKVRIIMEESPETRNSDLLLYIRYLQRFVCETQDEKNIIYTILRRVKTNIAWLTRERAFIKNTLWELLSDKQTRKFRKEEEMKKRNNFTPEKPSYF